MLKAAKERKQKNEFLISELNQKFAHMVNYIQNDMKTKERVNINTLSFHSSLKNKIFEETSLFQKKYFGDFKNAYSYYTTQEIYDFLKSKE